MLKLTVIASIEVRPEKSEEIKEALKKLVHASRKEEGCINYNLYVNNNNPAQFTMYENWQSRQLWVQHKKNVHLKEFEALHNNSILKASVEEFTYVQ